MNAEKIGFIEKREEGYLIMSRARKADTREDEIKKKWINFSIKQDMEKEKEQELIKLQDEYKEKRSRFKTLTDYS